MIFGKVTATEKNREDQLELAYTFIAHDRELAPAQYGPDQESADQGKNNLT